LTLWFFFLSYSFFRQERTQEVFLLSKGKGKNVQFNVDSKQRKLLKQKATDLLLIHPNNMLDKIETLEVWLINWKSKQKLT
jgi:hypothetical protein